MILNNSFFVLVFACLLLGPHGLAAEETKTLSPASFTNQLQKAQRAAVENDRYLAKKLFEELLRQHPREFSVYDLSATAWEWWGNHRKAIQIYQSWVQLNKESPTPFSVSERLAELAKKVELEEDLKDAPSWENAKTYQKSTFLVTTSLPDELSQNVLLEIEDILREEAQILEGIFGSPCRPRVLKINLVSGSEDYRRLWIKQAGNALDIRDAAYWQKENKILIYGHSANKGVLAHELAHHMISSYIENPSTIMSEGIAEYLSFRVAKEARLSDLQNMLEMIQYLDSQGQWQTLWDILDALNDYAGSAAMTDSYHFIKQENAFHYYMRAWAMIYFFVETQDSFFHNFLRKYLDYEAGQKMNTPATLRDYFFGHLSKEKLQDLDNAWGRLTVNLTYDEV